MTNTAVDEFAALWTGREPDLLTAAVHLARIGYPDLNMAETMEQVEHLGDLAALRLEGAPNEHTRLLRFNHFMFEEMGFRGELTDYYNPRNSFLNDVLVRRTGLPIALSVLMIVVGGRAGLRISGIGLPAHFVVRHEATDPRHRVYVDPYHRQILPNREACRRLVSRIMGEEVQLDESAFQPQTTKQIIVRMLANLKGAYLRRYDFEHALTVIDHLLTLLPGDARQWRDRGLMHYQLGHLRQAEFDLGRYLWLSDEKEEGRERIAQTHAEIQELLARLN